MQPVPEIAPYGKTQVAAVEYQARQCYQYISKELPPLIYYGHRIRLGRFNVFCLKCLRIATNGLSRYMSF